MLIDQLGSAATHYKVGLQSYLAFGRQFVEELLAGGKEVFLDLKFFDIPNTVRHAVYEAAAIGVSLVTVHALGGKAMLEAAVEEAQKHAFSGHVTNVLAVTYLTSFTQETLPLPWQRQSDFAQQVLDLAQVADDAGLHGVVCSALELSAVKERFAHLAALVPGIRPQGSLTQDQARVATPAFAKRYGANYLVVGRPITSAPDPRAALEAILQELL